MPQLKCPSCNSRGEVRETEEFYEVRGVWPDGHWPVRKCRNCGAGLIVKIRLAPPGAKAKRIDDATWAAMEASWHLSLGNTSRATSAKNEEGDSSRQTFEEWSKNPDLTGPLTVQQQFDRYVEEMEAPGEAHDESSDRDDDLSNEAAVTPKSSRESNGAQMSNLEMCKEFLGNDDWPYTELEEGPILKTGYSSDNGRWSVFVRADADGIVSVNSILAQLVPLDRRSEIAGLLTLANYGTRLGGFQFDLSDGEIRFHTSVDVDGAQLQVPMIKNLLYSNIFAMDAYFKAIMAVAYAGVDAVTAVATMEQEA